MSKPKTQAQLDRATDQRMLKTYGVGLDWYEDQLQLQGGGCAICHRPPGTRRLHVDHDHGWKKVKIETKKHPECGEWHSHAIYQGREYWGRGDKKADAIRSLKALLNYYSVRGLLCYSHNSGLQKFQDNPEFLHNAANYLEKHQGAKE